MDINSFNYQLPEEQIASFPASPRDNCKLMDVNKITGEISHLLFKDLFKTLNKGDVLVFNQSKVLPARLFGKKTTGGQVEILLVKEVGDNIWEVISRPGLKIGQKIIFSPQFRAEVVELLEVGELILKFNIGGKKLLQQIYKIGKIPIPPYIKYPEGENKLKSQYQTVYAHKLGSVAAPTAGLHFTKRLLKQLQGRGIQLEYIILHVGLGTFKPVTEENLKNKKIHKENYSIDKETARRLNQFKKEGRRIIAVGTTTLRVLESCSKKGKLEEDEGETDIFIFPPYQFRFVDGLITNFHLPKSSLLMLVSAFTSYPNTKDKFTNFQSSLIGKAYQEAISMGYRFYSFGDAQFIF